MAAPEKIPDYVRQNFQTLLSAGCNGDLAVLSAKHKETGSTDFLICAMRTDDDGLINAVPVARMLTEDPYEVYENPTGAPPDAKN